MRWRWIGLATAALTVAFVAWYPGHRLEAELEGARREGLPTELEALRREVGSPPDAQNAAVAIWAALDAERNGPLRYPRTDDLVRRFMNGVGGAEALRLALATDPAALEPWRSASKLPRLDFGHPPYADIHEYEDIDRAIHRLCAAAELGIDREENLRAAARLSALVRGEDSVLAQLVGIRFGRIVLRSAQKADRLRKTETELGDPPRLRAVLRAELAYVLDDIRLERGDGLVGRLTHAGPFRAAALASVVARWRRLLRDLPADDRDAAPYLRRQMPGVRAMIARYAAFTSREGRDPPWIEQLARESTRYAEERATLRVGF